VFVVGHVDFLQSIHALPRLARFTFMPATTTFPVTLSTTTVVEPALTLTALKNSAAERLTRDGDLFRHKKDRHEIISTLSRDALCPLPPTQMSAATSTR
jgi:hypothetical protein